VFRIREPAHVGEDGHDGGGDDRANAGNGLQPAEGRREGGARDVRRQGRFQRAPLRSRTAPEGAVWFDVVPQLAVPCQRGEQLRPPHLGAQTPTQVAQAGPAEESLHGVHLRGLQPHEVAAAAEELAKPGDGGRRHMHDGAIDPLPPPQAIAQLERIPAVTFLGRPVRLEPDLAGIHHDRRAPQAGQFPRDEERHRAGLQRDRGAGGQALRVVPAPESLGRRRYLPLSEHSSAPILDHEHARLAVHVHSHVAFHRAALLNAWGRRLG
jgi:hypothetical protein